MNLGFILTLEFAIWSILNLEWKPSVKHHPGETFLPPHLLVGWSFVDLITCLCGEIDADLLLAGHTHGGQVQLPGIGPLLTLYGVPRDWASGLTEIHPGQYLLVSRGIGLERGNAPRLRFLCRPELIVIYLEPAQ